MRTADLAVARPANAATQTGPETTREERWRVLEQRVSKHV